MGVVMDTLFDDLKNWESEKKHRQSRLPILVGCVYRYSSEHVLYSLDGSIEHKPEHGTLGLIVDLLPDTEDVDDEDVYEKDFNFSLLIFVNGMLCKLNDCLQKFVDVYQIYKSKDKGMERVSCQIFDE